MIIENVTGKFDPLELTIIRYLSEDPDNAGLSEFSVQSIRTHKHVKFGDTEEHVMADIMFTDETGEVREIETDLSIKMLREQYRARQVQERAGTPVLTSTTGDSPLGLPHSWDNNRAGIFKMFQTGSGRARGNMLDKLRQTDGKIVCRCLNQLSVKDVMCDHVLFAYLSGMDNNLLGLHNMSPTTVRSVQLPIGMGAIWIPASVSVAIDEDTDEPVGEFLLIRSGVELVLYAMLAVPDAGPFAMSSSEGVLSYVRYLEDMIRSTEHYAVLMADKSTGMNTALGVAGGCNRHHGPAPTATIIAGMRQNNPNRENWIIGNVASIASNKICLGCRNLRVGDNDVPDF